MSEDFDPLADDPTEDLPGDDLLENGSEAAGSDDAASEDETDHETDSDGWPSAAKQWLTTALHAPIIAFTSLGVLGATFRLSGRVPGASRFWKWVIAKGYRGLKRATSAQMVGHEIKEGRQLVKPLQWNKENSRWETPDGEEWWNGRDDGADKYRGPGGVQTAWAASESTQLGSHVQAQVSEALELGYGKALFTDADVSVRRVETAADGSEGAVADGGTAASARVTVDRPGILSDYVIPMNKLYIDPQRGEMVDARLLSICKYYETYPETVDSEEMHNQETRGRLAEQERDWGRYAMKMLLIAGAIIVLSLALFIVGPQLLSSAGGGGSGSGMGGLFPTLVPTLETLVG